MRQSLVLTVEVFDVGVVGGFQLDNSIADQLDRRRADLHVHVSLDCEVLDDAGQGVQLVHLRDESTLHQFFVILTRGFSELDGRLYDLFLRVNIQPNDDIDADGLVETKLHQLVLKQVQRSLEIDGAVSAECKQSI